VRTFADWRVPVPGYVEANLVSHSDPNASGSFAQTPSAAAPSHPASSIATVGVSPKNEVDF
jgi:hypothetical protein